MSHTVGQFVTILLIVVAVTCSVALMRRLAEDRTADIRDVAYTAIAAFAVAGFIHAVIGEWVMAAVNLASVAAVAVTVYVNTKSRSMSR